MAINYVTHDDGKAVVLLSGSADALRHLTGTNVTEIVGAIAMKCTHLEMTIDAQICKITKLTDEEVRVFLGRAMLDAKLTIFLDLAEIRLRHRQKEFKALKDLIAKLRELNTSRKIAVHGGWISWRTREEAMRGVKQFKTTAIKGGSRLSIEEAAAVPAKLSEKSSALVMLVNKIWPELE